ncbi:TraB/GumN family protein [Flavisphingomonas formosensis]|uniref:TraB/GumN family protein n=1 Tax=Flavisphingomonas formosensis TaxID=861534 RepID=UPI0012F9D079|nr:TraB/GumN family protein [Sphingomonas formosensis]
MKRSTLLASFLALVFAAPLPARAPVRETRPALWKLSDADTTIYLFGTIHALPTGTHWRDKRIDTALAASRELVLEAVFGDDPLATARQLYAIGVKPGLPPLAERVAPTKRAELEALVKRSGMPPATLDKMKTWTAGILLFGHVMKDLGISSDAGVEAELRSIFAAAKKPIAGLETPAQQLGYLDSLSEDEQRIFLEGVIDDPARSKAELDAMLAAWRRGDEQAIARSFENDPEMSPMLKEVLLRRRNEAWTDWLIKRLDTPGTIFVAVGAGHLAGPDSVRAMLEKHGLKVTRVQ